jgi:hypothetical protein
VLSAAVAVRSSIIFKTYMPAKEFGPKVVQHLPHLRDVPTQKGLPEVSLNMQTSDSYFFTM